MASVHDFIIALACTDEPALEALELANMSYGDRSISRSAVYKIYAKVKAKEDVTDQRKHNGQAVAREDSPDLDSPAVAREDNPDLDSPAVAREDSPDLDSPAVAREDSPDLGHSERCQQ